VYPSSLGVFSINAPLRYVFATFQIDTKDGAQDQTPTRTIPTFLTLYIFGFFYQLVLVWDALRLKNTIQIIGLCIYNVGLLIYGAVQMEQIKQAVLLLAGAGDINSAIWGQTKPFLIAIPVILAFGTGFLSVAAWKLYDEFAWTIYKHISADLRMKRRYLTFQIYIALLKFDFFFFLGFTVQFVVIVQTHKSEFALTIAAIPVTIFILVMAAFWTRRENLTGMILTIVCRQNKHLSERWLTCVSDSLLCWTGIFHLQASADVRTRPPGRLSTSTQRIDDLCGPDHHPYPNDHC
jgi:hypothetical protein